MDSKLGEYPNLNSLFGQGNRAGASIGRRKFIHAFSNVNVAR